MRRLNNASNCHAHTRDPAGHAHGIDSDTGANTDSRAAHRHPDSRPDTDGNADRTVTIGSLGINVALDGSCGDQLTYVPIGIQVCYWNQTAGGGGFFSFAGSTTGPLSALHRAAAGATMTWTVAGKSYTRRLSGRSQAFPLDTGHDVPPGQPAYLQVRTVTTVVEYDAEI
ncbi:MAG: hypothetical protein WB804_08770 [Candidatus Dormiibacterota bacterium]